jgi:hypothetical protein
VTSRLAVISRTTPCPPSSGLTRVSRLFQVHETIFMKQREIKEDLVQLHGNCSLYGKKSS